MGKISERQGEKYKIWTMAVLLTGACISLYYFHVILGIGTIITHIFYVPIILASIWWKRKGLVVALFSSGLLIFSHVVLRPDVAIHNDYFRAFMFIVIAFVVAELSRRIAKEHEALQAANRQLSADEQQLRAANQQLRAGERQLKASNQQLRANEQQLVNEVAERKKAEERIREQREFLRNTIESLGHPFYVIDANDNTVKMANVAAWQGKLPEKTTCYMLSHKQNKPCSGADHPCPLEDVKKTKQPVIVEHIHYDKDGNPRNVEVHCYPIFDNEQNVTQIIEYCLDITDRKKIEEALRESENSYRAVVENAVEGIVVVQGQTLQFVNPTLVSMIGYSEKELLTRPFIEFIHPDHREWAMGIHIKRLKGEEVPPVYELKIVDKKGNTKWLENNGILIKWRNRPATLNFLRDITERKKAEEALQLERDNFINILDSMEDGVYIVDQNHDIQYVNPALKKDFGPYEGRKCYEYFHDRKEICPWCKNEEVFAGKTVRWEWYSFKNQRTYDLIDTPLRNPDGSISKLEIFRDITERKKAEEALRVANQQLIASQEEIQSLANFPSENSNPVLRIAKDGIVLYSNEAGMSLLTAWGTQMGRRLPDKWRKFTADVFASGSSKETECEYGDCVFSLAFTPIVDLGYVNIYGLDITERKKAEQKLIENRAKLKSLASQLSLIEERERHRLATELHDQIGQSLVMSKMKLDSLRESVSSSESADVIGEVSDCLGQIIQDTRTLTFDLSSPILYELGFEAAVADWLDEQIREKHGIKTEFEDDGQPKPLDDDIRVLLFRDVRELLINVVRHANAKNIKVSIWKMDKNICVRVEDDGVGFDVTEVESMVAKKAKFGLFSVRERLEESGGHLEIESEPGRGTKVTMTAPLKYEKNTEGAQV